MCIISHAVQIVMGNAMNSLHLCVYLSYGIKQLLHLKHTTPKVCVALRDSFSFSVSPYLPPTDISDVPRWYSESTSAMSDRVHARREQHAQTQVPWSSSLSAEHYQRGRVHGALQRNASAYAKRWAIICHILSDLCDHLWVADRQQQEKTRWVKSTLGFLSRKGFCFLCVCSLSNWHWVLYVLIYLYARFHIFSYSLIHVMIYAVK